MSLRLEKDNSSEDQKIMTTLFDNLSSISSGQTYYFEFEFEQTGEKFNKTLEDISPYPARYNLFNVRTSGDTTNSIIFTNEGWYKYNVYLNTGKTYSLEMGKCLVHSNNTPTQSLYEPTIEKFVYKK